MRLDEAIKVISENRQTEDALRVVVAHMVQTQIDRVWKGEPGADGNLRWALDLAQRMLPGDKLVQNAGVRLAGVNLKRE